MAPVWNSIATPVSYSASAKVMHWFVAAAVIMLLALGPVMKRLVPEGSLRDNLYTFHEALGALVLIVMAVRLVRRLAFGVPAPDASMPPIEQRASLWVQYALYVLLFVTTVLAGQGPTLTAIRSAFSVSSIFLPSSARINRCRTALSSGISSAGF
jgi:cytochrome b561